MSTITKNLLELYISFLVFKEDNDIKKDLESKTLRENLIKINYKKLILKIYKHNSQIASFQQKRLTNLITN